jgi:hypothetical protein
MLYETELTELYGDYYGDRSSGAPSATPELGLARIRPRNGPPDTSRLHSVVIFLFVDVLDFYTVSTSIQSVTICP